ADPIAEAGPVTVPQPPARALPYGIVADLRLDLGIAHPRVIVPCGVVGAYVFEAKPIIVVQIQPGFRRAKVTAGDAAGVVAQPHRRRGRPGQGGGAAKTPAP